MTTDLVPLASLWRGHAWWAVAIVGLRLAVSTTWIVQALASASIFAALLRPTPGTSLIDAMFASAMVLATALLVRPALQIVGQLAAYRAMTAVKRDLRISALHALIHRSARDPRGRSGADHALVVDGVENLDAYLAGYLPQVLVTVVVSVGVGSVMIAIDPAAGIAAVIVALAVPIIPRLWGRLLAARGGDQWEAYQALQAEFVDSMQGMTTLVAFGAEARREAQLQVASSSLLARTIAQLRFSLVDSGLAALALAGAPAAVLIVLAVDPKGDAAATVFLLLLLAIELVRPLRDLAALWHAGYVGTYAGRAIIALLGRAPRISTDSSAPMAPGDDHGADDHDAVEQVVVEQVVVERLVVRHPGSSADALRIEHLRFDRGLTAIVGRSGAGKSTLAAALVGLTQPDAGAISINGRVMPPERLLRVVSLVPQDPALFGGTIAEEIGRGDREADVRAVAAAATEAGIGNDDQTIGLGTPVGEGGALLSGGQRQRVAIARALVQRRGVLVLDEATSALDPASEARLIARLRVESDRVLIAITHRADVVGIADSIIRIDDGVLIASGRSGGTLVAEDVR